MRVKVPAILQPLLSRKFRRLWFGQVVSGIGDGIFPVALTFAVLTTKHGPIGLGIVLTADAAGAAAGSLSGGIAADRFGRVRVMIAADLLRLSAVLGLAVGYKYSFPVTVICASVIGFGGAVFSPAYFGAVRQLLGQDELQASNALRSATTRVTRLAGPLLGGFIAGVYSPRAAFLVDGATFVVSLATLAGLTSAVTGGTSAGDGIIKSAAEGLKSVTGRYRWIGAVIIQGVFQMTFVIGPEVILLPLVLRYQADLNDYGWILALQGLGTTIGAIIASKWKPALPGLTAMLAMLAVVPELIILSVNHFPIILLAISVVLTGWGYTTFAVLWGTALQREVPEQALSRVASLDSFGGYIFMPASMALTGFAVASAGLAFVISASIIVLTVSTAVPLLVAGVPQFSTPEPVLETSDRRGVGT